MLTFLTLANMIEACSLLNPSTAVSQMFLAASRSASELVFDYSNLVICENIEIAVDVTN